MDREGLLNFMQLSILTILAGMVVITTSAPIVAAEKIFQPPSTGLEDFESMLEEVNPSYRLTNATMTAAIKFGESASELCPRSSIALELVHLFARGLPKDELTPPIWCPVAHESYALRVSAEKLGLGFAQQGINGHELTRTITALSLPRIESSDFVLDPFPSAFFSLLKAMHFPTQLAPTLTQEQHFSPSDLLTLCKTSLANNMPPLLFAERDNVIKYIFVLSIDNDEDTVIVLSNLESNRFVLSLQSLQELHTHMSLANVRSRVQRLTGKFDFVLGKPVDMAKL